MSKRVIILCAFLAIPTFAMADPVIIDTASFGGHTYYLLSDDTWQASETKAVSLGGHLVTVNDSTENNFLLSAFAKYQKNMWIGLTDQAVEGTFVWVSGQPVTYTN